LELLFLPPDRPGGESTEAVFSMFNGQPFGASDWWHCVIFDDSNWEPPALTSLDFVLSLSFNLLDIDI
jgi:hypothetical protein